MDTQAVEALLVTADQNLSIAMQALRAARKQLVQSQLTPDGQPCDHPPSFQKRIAGMGDQSATVICMACGEQVG